MKNITVFLASSDELKNDRNSFHSLVASLDEIFEPRGYRIRCRRWEDFSAFCTGTRTQDDYNRIVRASDICICMFHRKAGEYTIEEFNQALDEYVKNQSHPKTFVYIRALIEGEMEDEALKRFKEDLFDRVGHYWCNYATDDAMKLHFVMQLERIIPSVSGNASVTEGNHFKIENGVDTLLIGMASQFEATRLCIVCHQSLCPQNILLGQRSCLLKSRLDKRPTGIDQ